VFVVVKPELAGVYPIGAANASEFVERMWNAWALCWRSDWEPGGDGGGGGGGMGILKMCPVFAAECV